MKVFIVILIDSQGFLVRIVNSLKEFFVNATFSLFSYEEAVLEVIMSFYLKFSETSCSSYQYRQTSCYQSEQLTRTFAKLVFIQRNKNIL